MNMPYTLTGVVGAMLLATATTAQEPEKAALPTVVEGLTLDAQSGLPFPNVQVRFDTGERVTSDGEGRYRIEGVPPGAHRVALVTARCNVTFGTLTLAPGEIRRVAFQVPSEVLARSIDAEAAKKRSEGKVIGADELLRGNARSLLEVLRREAPDMVGPMGAQPGSRGVLQGRTRTAQGAAAPVVVLDELVMGDGVGTLRDLRPQDVASIEILKGAGRGWAYGTDGAGGVIKITTRKGEPGHGQAHPDRCAIGDWTGDHG